jgi:hypothetical protein
MFKIDASLTPQALLLAMRRMWALSAARIRSVEARYRPEDGALAFTARYRTGYWDTGAPQLWRLGDYLDRPSEPFNDHEPVETLWC